MDDLPSDVHAVLGQLLAEAQVAIGERDHEAARTAVDSVDEVASNKLPESEQRRRLQHGCERVRALLEDGDNDDYAAAAAYLSSMQRRVE
ncbi:hypothetical protein JCM30237_28790 [Halolamina litorea]|jgi:hypothetical protein|uniref:DUF8101 domain-containing protein n=1 Tax=Halolamina litorea TaxID=1515593 RepID=A0ABD6BSM2_9EURY|nr:hypothetical protein [Halolamina litorea]